jgi:hypothetical protein
MWTATSNSAPSTVDSLRAQDLSEVLTLDRGVELGVVSRQPHCVLTAFGVVRPLCSR